MMNFKTILTTLALVIGTSGVAVAADAHSTPHIEKQSWSFAGIFGTYDQNQLQRGFQVFREVCASCHGARLIAFRNLQEEGGPSFSEEQVKALAAEYEVDDATADGGRRKAVPADRWPSPFATEQDARDANGGALPPDFSVLAKARGVTDAFPFWVFNYFTGYSEGGPDYIHALLNGYHEEVPESAPHNSDGTPFDLAEGKHYNDYFPGHAIGMAPPLSDGLVTYVAAEGEAEVPQTLDQYSQDVAAYMMWMAEPHLAGRKQTGFVVLLFLIGFSALMYLTKRRIWQGIEH
ncbi:ubiquinol-cytochrome c reductase cytochrome c1 subunit [Devosia sp. YR412]|uniref:cytochrome c1 n=1 Tax=Devosia sp. YR412 TaxID=1881030 RepID=UPI0008C5EE6B|nr:cytochrome c1 [Devosia sp. YR412]SEQ06040.1 ubiquinol-cytochrome c reductase cytochrome c1 subunit [Devosia sp. YR412]